MHVLRIVAAKKLPEIAAQFATPAHERSCIIAGFVGVAAVGVRFRIARPSPWRDQRACVFECVESRRQLRPNFAHFEQ